MAPTTGLTPAPTPASTLAPTPAPTLLPSCYACSEWLSGASPEDMVVCQKFNSYWGSYACKPLGYLDQCEDGFVRCSQDGEDEENTPTAGPSEVPTQTGTPGPPEGVPTSVPTFTSTPGPVVELPSCHACGEWVLGASLADEEVCQKLDNWDVYVCKLVGVGEQCEDGFVRCRQVGVNEEETPTSGPSEVSTQSGTPGASEGAPTSIPTETSTPGNGNEVPYCNPCGKWVAGASPQDREVCQKLTYDSNKCKPLNEGGQCMQGYTRCQQNSAPMPTDTPSDVPTSSASPLPQTAGRYDFVHLATSKTAQFMLLLRTTGDWTHVS
eukprot:scaffold328093_cov45-Prasinocladus_malaysianus.AAC.1